MHSHVKFVNVSTEHIDMVCFSHVYVSAILVIHFFCLFSYHYYA